MTKLDKEHRAALVNGAKKIREDGFTSNIVITFYPTVECEALAKEVLGLLQAAGWSRHNTPMIRVDMIEGQPEGEGIVVADEPTAQSRIVVRLLLDAGIAVVTRRVKDRVSENRRAGTEEVLVEIWPEG